MRWAEMYMHTFEAATYARGSSSAALAKVLSTIDCQLVPAYVRKHEKSAGLFTSTDPK